MCLELNFIAIYTRIAPQTGAQTVFSYGATTEDLFKGLLEPRLRLISNLKQPNPTQIARKDTKGNV